eukprot:TRINITY_DN43_c0_g6_i2.p4 TRINITY_DN43_c0_g6~~TRINITY_DN43_c0_g6_i2.p4  ORF type:complete len:524 (+),score=-115.34 TRINITY_DN43_c0_g6_i2:7024-8595(+)
MNTLKFLIVACFFSIGIILLIPRNRIVILRYVALFMSSMLFIISLILLLEFNYRCIAFQNVFELNLHIFENSCAYGIDGISLMFIILTTFLIPICIISSWVSIGKRLKEFLLLLFLIEFLLINFFSVLDIFLFYVFFESVLIPMFIVIGLWGSRSRRIHAAYQFFLYTFFGSVFMLYGIIYIYLTVGTTDYISLLTYNFESIRIQKALWLAFFISFAVKIPMVPVHIWLPEAHVEAPTAGSVLLAGVLLKLGAYGFLRFSIPLFPFASEYFRPLVFTMSVIAILYTSMTTLRQVDLKKVVAYTSIAHMNLVMVGLFSQTLVGVEGSIALMLSHGLVSSGLFLCVGVLYDRYGTRLLRYYGGLINLMPLFGFVFLWMSLANMGLPLTSSFIGEFAILLGAFTANSLAAFGAAFGVIFSGAYSMWLFNRIMFGPLNDAYIAYFSDLNRREFFYMFVLSFLILFFGIFPNSVLEVLHMSVSNNILTATADWPFYDISYSSQYYYSDFDAFTQDYMIGLLIFVLNVF